MRYKELTFEGRNAVLEAFRSGKTIDKLRLRMVVFRDYVHNHQLCREGKT